MTRLPPPAMPGWLSELVPFDRYMVDVGGWRMHVMESGSGFPVVMLHGNPTWGFLYRKIACKLIGEPLRVIMPDLIGLGFSDKPRAGHLHTMENHSFGCARCSTGSNSSSSCSSVRIGVGRSVCTRSQARRSA